MKKILTFTIPVIVLSLSLIWINCDQILSKVQSEKLKKAIINDDYRTVTSYIDKGLDINNYKHCGFLPLQEVASNGSLKMTKFLIDKGADVNACAEDDTTAIFFFNFKNKINVLKLLLERGADPDVADNMGYSVLHFYTGFHSAHELMKILIKSGADVNIKDNKGFTPLMSAILSRKLKNVHLLIDSGALIDQEERHGWTCLFIASMAPDTDRIVRALLKSGASITHRAKNGITPLGALIISREIDKNEKNSKEKLNLIRLFVKRGAEINSRDNKLNTPLHHAVERNKLSRVQLLLELGADKTLKNKKGELPVDIARRKHFTEIIEILN